MQRPDLGQFSDVPMFNTKSVVQQTGVPAPTLRAWERRYALLAPKRTEHAYRLYTERDVVLIRWLKQRVDEGMSISRAIALFHHLSEHQGQELSAKAVQQDIPPQVQDRNDDEASPSRDYAAVKSSILLPQGFANKNAEEFFHAAPLSFSNASPTQHTFRVAQDNLLKAFQQLDEQSAHMIMGSLLSLYPIEQICIELIMPVLWRIGQLWAEGKLNISTEHFASNFFRGLLTNRFHVTPAPPTGPLAITCSAPGESHELAALMLALFLRLRGLRVAYLGQSMETNSLLHTLQELHPALLCVSVTLTTYLPAMLSLAEHVQQLPLPRPLFAFGGQAYAQNTALIEKTPGHYLSGNLREVANTLRQMVLESGPST